MGSQAFILHLAMFLNCIKKIKFVQNNPEKLREFSENARKVYLEKYSPEQNIQQVDEIYVMAAEYENKLSHIR
jgi:hypothetical protein